MILARLSLLAEIILTLTAAPAPDSVTEHFARARPGTVPRIPASLFLQTESQSYQETDHSHIRSDHLISSYFPSRTLFSSLTLDCHRDQSLRQTEAGPEVRPEPESEEVKYFTAYPSLTSPADSTLPTLSASLKDLPTTERIAERVTQPPEKPVSVHQSGGISEVADSDLISASGDQTPQTVSRAGPQENSSDISHTEHGWQTGNYS